MTAVMVDPLLSAADAEEQLGIPAYLVRQWAHRKRLWSMGLDAFGRPLYYHEDLVALRDRSRTRDQNERERRKRR